MAISPAADALQFGPRYCETPDPIGGFFPIETWNAYSSMVICVWGLAAWYLVWRHAPRAWLLHLMCLLLVTNGVGSTLWHGLRTRWALSLDTNPAIIFVVIGACLWARRVVPLWQALTLVVVLIAMPFALRFIPFGFPAGFIIVNAIAVLAAGIWLVVRTWRSAVPGAHAAARSGTLALVLASLALSFRSFDLTACAELGFGSHFLWHVTLSAAAFTLMVTLLRLEPRKI